MNQLLEVTNIKNEPTDSTSSNRLEILTKIQVENIKQESDCVLPSEIYIKTEPLENESEFLAIKGTSYEMYPNNDIKVSSEEPLIKIECQHLKNEILQDPLDVGNDIKVKIPPSNSEGETSKKPGWTGEEEEYCLKSNDWELHGSSTSKNHYQFFVRNKKVGRDKKYICFICSKTFVNKSDLNRHLLIHSGSKPFKCEICKKTFTQKGNMDSHMLIHSGEKPYVCDLCKKLFRDKSSLNKHKLIHSGVKSFFCNECEKSFAQKHHLVIHKRIHSGDKPYSCGICDKAFVQKSDLTKHTRTHTGEKPYSCNVCAKSFSDKPNLDRHKKIHMKQ